MASQTVRFEYDAGRNILFTEDDYEITTEKDVDDFVKINLEQLEKIGHKMYIICKIDGLHISASVSEYYGKRIKEIIGQYNHGFARYGENPAARMTVRTASRKADLESNIYSSREEAIEAIVRMQNASGSDR